VKTAGSNDSQSTGQNSAIPKDSTVNFVPTSLKYNDSTINIDAGTWYSPTLHIAKEKVLYNSYLGHDIYRFSWFRSFDEPVFITINRKDDNYWLTIKKLSKPFVNYQEDITFIPPNASGNEEKARQEEHDPMMDALRLPPKIVKNHEVKITKANWDTFERELNKCNYWKLQPSDPRRPGLDGSEWIIEAHFKDRYWFVDRRSPRDNFRNCGEHLLRLSGLEEEIY
jgi:hypothetical protein